MPRKMIHYCPDKGFKGTVVNRALPSSEKKNTKCQNKKNTYFWGNSKIVVWVYIRIMSCTQYAENLNTGDTSGIWIYRVSHET